jgi:hypothetical protein
VLEKITHNAAGRSIDQYTHWDWEPRCQAVLCLDYAGMAAARALRANALPRNTGTITGRPAKQGRAATLSRPQDEQGVLAAFNRNEGPR